MKIEIQASHTSISPQELKAHLSPKTLDALKGKKAHPWIVGESGSSQPRDLAAGGKSRRLHWTNRAIQALRKAVQTGTKLFIAHGKGTNSHDGRTSVGEVLETFERQIPGGGLQAIAVTALDSERPDLDVCSIEAEVDIDQNGEVLDVPRVSAVALGDSRVDSPAFPGAQRLAAMQFFGDDDEKGEKSMTYAEIKAGVEQLGLAPHRLFTADQIREDNRLMKDLDRSEEIAALTKERDDFKTKAEGLETQVKEGAEARTKLALAESKKKLEAVIPEGTTDAQKKFLIDEFRPEGENDLTDEALGKYVENGTKRFAEYAKMFGGQDNPPGGGADDGSGDTDKKPEDALLDAITG